MTYLFDDKIRYDDSPNIDAFGGLRTTNARLLGEYRYKYGVATAYHEFNDVMTNGGTLTADFARCCFLANTTTTSGSTVIRQTKQYHPYISGTSNKCLITFKFDTAKANVVQSVGAFDDSDGIIFRMNGTTPQVVIRKGGSDVEVVSRTSWNLDRLDGSMNEFNKSGVTADFSKCHILTLDYQWLGVGRVRVGFVIDGEIIYVHEFLHANQTNEVYIYQPSLPLRWEIKNSGVAASNSSMMIICGAAYCEGAEYESGYNRSVSTDGTDVTANNTTEGRCVLAIRLKNTLNGQPNHAMARLKDWTIFSNNDVNYKIVLLDDASKLNNNPTWTSVPGRSTCEYVKDVNMVSGWMTDNSYDVIIDGFAQGAVGAGSGTNAIRNLENDRNNAIFQNYSANSSQVLAIVAYKLKTDAIIKANMVWVEIK